MLSSNKSRGILAVIGNLLVDIAVGEINLLGFLYPYFVSYFRIYNPKIEMKDMKIIPMMWLITQIFSCPFGIFVYMKLGFKWTYVLFISSFCLVQYLSSFITNFHVFAYIYGISGGLSQGALLILPLYCSWRYFPKSYKPRVAGIILSAYAISPLFTSQIALYAINPENKPQIFKDMGETGKKIRVFEDEVALRVPNFLKWLGLVCFIMGISGVLMILEPIKEEQRGEEFGEEEVEKVGEIAHQNFGEAIQCFKKEEFKALYFAIVIGYLFPHMMNFSFKEIGLNSLNDDKYVTFVGSVGALVNGVCRFFAGYSFEIFNFSKSAAGIMVMILITSLVYLKSAENKFFYLVATCLFEITYGAQLGLYPLISDKLFGDKGAISYAYLFSGFTFSNIISLSLYTWLTPVIGLQAHFILIGLISAVNLVFINWVAKFENLIDFNDKENEDSNYIELKENIGDGENK